MCCEGSTDVGPLTVLIKKCSSQHELNIDCRTHDELKKISLLKTEFPKGFIKNNDRINRVAYIRRLLHIANVSGSTNIALHQDTGHQNFWDVYHGIHNDFNAVLQGSIKRLAIVPKEMTESWLLSDVMAINSLGDGKTHVDQSPNPETLWGDKDDPKSNYPKNYLKQNLEKLGVKYNSESCTRIAKKTDIEVLRNRCPLSFGQFYSDMQSFIVEEDTP
jgi:hypothetical protein